MCGEASAFRFVNVWRWHLEAEAVLRVAPLGADRLVAQGPAPALVAPAGVGPAEKGRKDQISKT